MWTMKLVRIEAWSSPISSMRGLTISVSCASITDRSDSRSGWPTKRRTDAAAPTSGRILFAGASIRLAMSARLSRAWRGISYSSVSATWSRFGSRWQARPAA